MAELLRRADVRLITLSGPGGSGKTRLGIQAAVEVQEDFADGVWFVNLAPISDPALVVPTIAQTLDLREQAAMPLVERLTAYLRDKQLLLVLDNFEHLLGAALMLAGLLATCPRLKLLITSRAVLHLRGEHVLEVLPLALPDLHTLPQLAILSQYAAVQLFIERTRDVNPDFQVTNASAPAVAEICARLDGLPLALELAAAHGRLFSPQALLARLEHHLPLPRNGPRDLPSRQQTIRNTIDWSYQLLDAAAQRLFARLGVFVGGWTLEAAAAVCNADEDLPLEVVDGVTALLDKSLLMQQAGPESAPRLTMLETIREYALERLAESGEDESVRRHHAAFFLALAEAAEPKLQEAAQGAWLDRLQEEHDNLRAVLVWGLAGSDYEIGVRLASALLLFWWMRGYGHEGRNWLEEALRCSDKVAPAIRAKILLAVASSASVHGELERAATLSGEALAVFRNLGDTSRVASILVRMADMAWWQANYAQATALCIDGLDRFRELGDRSGMAYTLHKLGDIARDQGDFSKAQTLLAESVEMWRELGHREAVAFVLNGLGDVALSQMNYALATAQYQEALALFQSMGGQDGIAWIRRNLGRLAHIQDDDMRASTLLRESVAWFQEVGDALGLAWTLHLLGTVTHSLGDTIQGATLLREALVLQTKHGYKSRIVETLEAIGYVLSTQKHETRAAQLLGAAAKLREAIGAPLPPSERATYERTLVVVRAQLGEDAFAAAWAEGRAMTLEQAVAYALEEGASDAHAEQCEPESPPPF